MADSRQTETPVAPPAPPVNAKAIQFREVEMPPHLQAKISNALKYGREAAYLQPVPARRQD